MPKALTAHEQPWNDAVLLEMVRDTRAWITTDHTGGEVGDFVDMRMHLMVLWTLARGVCWRDPSDRDLPTPAPTIVEIGVRSGISTLAFLSACKESGGTLHSIDNDLDGCPVAVASIERAGLSDWWRFYRMSSDRWIAKPPVEFIDCLLIDGDHTEKQVRTDFENYQRWVRPDGFILLHDHYEDAGCSLESPGIANLVRELKTRPDLYEVVTLPWSFGLTMVRVL